MITRRRNISIHKIIILEHSRGWDYIHVDTDTGVWYERSSVFPAKMMKRKEKKKFKMRYKGLFFRLARCQNEFI